jgi:hypothetical protein
MWWVRSEMVPELSAASAPGERSSHEHGAERRERLASRAPAAYREMVQSYWSHVLASVAGPFGFPGKLLAHSSNWVKWRTIFDETEAAAVAAAAWDASLLGQTHQQQGVDMSGRGGGPAASPESERASAEVWAHRNRTGPLKGWCLKADPCPLHAFTHAPPSLLPSRLGSLLNCSLQETRGAASLHPETRWLKGSFRWADSEQGMHSRAARLAMVSEHMATPGAGGGVCAFASRWVRSARERAGCAASSGDDDGSGSASAAACAELDVKLAVTQLEGEGGRPVGEPEPGRPHSVQLVLRSVPCEE